MGHTEYIKKITKSKDVLMMLASDQLKVALATTHIPLRDVTKAITKDLIINNAPKSSFERLKKMIQRLD